MDRCPPMMPLAGPTTDKRNAALPSLCRSWKMSCGSGEYVRLMENYPLVTGAAAPLLCAIEPAPPAFCADPHLLCFALNLWIQPVGPQPVYAFAAAGLLACAIWPLLLCGCRCCSTACLRQPLLRTRAQLGSPCCCLCGAPCRRVPVPGQAVPGCDCRHLPPHGRGHG